jgi:hypothetical protein
MRTCEAGCERAQTGNVLATAAINAMFVERRITGIAALSRSGVTYSSSFR